jgi:hypothetical protein
MMSHNKKVSVVRVRTGVRAGGLGTTNHGVRVRQAGPKRHSGRVRNHAIVSSSVGRSSHASSRCERRVQPMPIPL